MTRCPDSGWHYLDFTQLFLPHCVSVMDFFSSYIFCIRYARLTFVISFQDKLKAVDLEHAVNSDDSCQALVQEKILNDHCHNSWGHSRLRLATFVVLPASLFLPAAGEVMTTQSSLDHPDEQTQIMNSRLSGAAWPPSTRPWFKINASFRLENLEAQAGTYIHLWNLTSPTKIPAGNKIVNGNSFQPTLLSVCLSMFFLCALPIKT